MSAADLLGIDRGHLSVRRAAEPVGHRGTIDTMLISVAEHGHERSVSVLLGGLGSDDGAGVTATKKFGGLSIAEAETPEDHNGEQGVAGALGVVDLHVPVDAIASQIALYLNNVASLAAEPQVARLFPTVSRQAEAIAERYAPAYIVVDAQGDVLHFSGRTGASSSRSRERPA